MDIGEFRADTDLFSKKFKAALFTCMYHLGECAGSEKCQHFMFLFSIFICFIHTLIHALIYGKIRLSKNFSRGWGLGWGWRSVFVVWYQWGLQSIYGNFTICLI